MGRLIGHHITWWSEMGKNPLQKRIIIFRAKKEASPPLPEAFIGPHDVSLPARDAITRGKAPSFFVMNGHDLMTVLCEAISLTTSWPEASSSSR